MTSEEKLVKRFNEILREMDIIVRAYAGSLEPHQTQQFITSMQKEVSELESIGIEKVKLEEAIASILKKVEQDIRKILANTQLTETESRIKSAIDTIKGYLENDARNRYTTSMTTYSANIAHLSSLEVAEQDLV